MNASSSPGFEELSDPFLKYAYPGNEKDKNAIAPYLANLFHVALSEKHSCLLEISPDLPPLQKRL
jgi:hypothetical protein